MKNVEGYIAYFGLQEWWFSSFTDNERKYIDDCYQPIGTKPHPLTEGIIRGFSQPATEFLNGLNTWFRRKNDSTIAERIHQKLSKLANEQPIIKPGYYKGKHFTTWVRDYETLKKNGNNLELEKLLIGLVEATEAESVIDDQGVAPAYYNELAIYYRKQKEYDKEVSILERFKKQKHAPGMMPAKLFERLVKAKELLTSQLKST